MRKKLFISLLFLLSLIVFKGQLYRLLVHYEFKSERAGPGSCALNISIDSNDDIELLAIAKEAQRRTSQKLYFNASNPSTKAADIFNEGHGNCVGYSRVAAQLIRCHDPGANRFNVSQVAATIHFCGISVHQFFDGPFFMDHDIVVINDLQTGNQLAIDPSLHDYSGISFVRYK